MESYLVRFTNTEILLLDPFVVHAYIDCSVPDLERYQEPIKRKDSLRLEHLSIRRCDTM
jgi:hypothetical protein